MDSITWPTVHSRDAIRQYWESWTTYPALADARSANSVRPSIGRSVLASRDSSPDSWQRYAEVTFFENDELDRGSRVVIAISRSTNGFCQGLRGALKDLFDAHGVNPISKLPAVDRLYEALVAEGYPGKDDSVYRFVKLWREERARRSADVFIPLVFAPGEAYQFDWSYETVELDGEAVMVKVAHFRLCHSRHYFVRAYLREAQEQVFDAHNRAFAFFGGVTRRGIYDNLKTCVDAVLRGKDRSFDARFLQLCNHYLLEPTACTPAAGWEKGQVENQVNEVRQRLFRPRPKFADIAALNTWLESQCSELAQRRAHPEQRGRTVWEVYQDERAVLRSRPTPFPTYREIETRASATSLVRFDANRYSVDCRAAGRRLTLRADAERIVIVHEETIVADHPRSFDRYQTIYEPWHYLPALARKPGALRNGAPFVDWSLPAALTEIRRKSRAP